MKTKPAWYRALRKITPIVLIVAGAQSHLPALFIVMCVLSYLWVLMDEKDKDGLQVEQIRCDHCGNMALNCAPDEGDGGWWCPECRKTWEEANNAHWEDGAAL